jgi:hypothetical protein
LTAVAQLKQVVQGRSADHSGGFPFCRYYLVAVASDPETNQPSDYRTYRFQIDIIQENTNKSKANAEADFEDAIDAALDKLNAKWQLPDGSNVPTVDNTVIQVSPVREAEMNGGPCLVVSIQLDCKTLIY